MVYYIIYHIISFYIISYINYIIIFNEISAIYMRVCRLLRYVWTWVVSHVTDGVFCRSNVT